MDTLGKRLRRLRDEARINQADAAAADGIGRPHLSKIEADKDPPSLEARALLAAMGATKAA
jgi:transcriptional regulator with XRE-family HTH domain